MKHYCNVTFVEEGTISPDGDGTPIKLMRCSRCGGAFYRGKDEQRSHWRIHKKVCKPSPPEEIARVGNLSMNEAASELMGLLQSQNIKAGSLWTLLLQRIDHLFRHSTDRSACFDEEIMTNTAIGRGMILSCARQLAFASDSDMQLLWAIPNLANFLLSVDLISDCMAKKKRRGVELSEDDLMSFKFDPAVHTDSGWANLLVLFLMAGAVSRTPSTGGLIGGLSHYTYRKTAYAGAAFRRMVELWKDPYTRASLVLQKNKVTSVRQEWMPLAIMNVIDQSPADPLHIAPGLSIYDAVTTVVAEAYVYSRLRLKEMIGCILDTYPFEPEAWRNFTAEKRAECALMVVDKLATDTDRVLLAAELAAGLTGWPTREDQRGRYVKDASLRLKVLTLASRNRTPIAEQSNNLCMVPADFFGMFYDKIVDVQMPLVRAYVKAVKNNSREEVPQLPNELLWGIAEFACDPFCKESRFGLENGPEGHYIGNIWPGRVVMPLNA
ncbi:hypothetical protein ACHAXT_003715 [Thalassiosira profunda]